ncbi:heme-binding protein, partial [Flavobacteriaceae bacterium]|nr:heme-binding protein [Flavobacteriaceae bacterium]
MNKYIILITFLLLNSSLVMSQKYETQEYQVIDQIDKIEIRYYPSAPMIRVSSNQSRNNNFGKLFRYIAGNNNNEEKIAMTTPVYMSNQSKTMEFVLPKRFLSGDIPVPNDNDVETYISEPKYYAA